jgi:carboxymethylenebutenolidase
MTALPDDAYLAIPTTRPAPGLVVLPPVFGIEPVVRRFTDACAARGFLALAINQFRHDAEPGPLARNDEGRARAQARARRVDVDVLVDDVRGAIEALRARADCNGRVGAIGICFGGRYAFLAAARLGVDAVATFHGTQIGLSLADAPNVHAPMTLHFGGDDPLTPPEEVAAIRAALAGRDDAEVVVHRGAVHNFSLPGVPGYNPEVMEAAQRRAFEVLDHLKEPQRA